MQKHYSYLSHTFAWMLITSTILTPIVWSLGTNIVDYISSVFNTYIGFLLGWIVVFVIYFFVILFLNSLSRIKEEYQNNFRMWTLLSTMIAWAPFWGMVLVVLNHNGSYQVFISVFIVLAILIIVTALILRLVTVEHSGRSACFIALLGLGAVSASIPLGRLIIPILASIGMTEAFIFRAIVGLLIPVLIKRAFPKDGTHTL